MSRTLRRRKEIAEHNGWAFTNGFYVEESDWIGRQHIPVIVHPKGTKQFNRAVSEFHRERHIGYYGPSNDTVQCYKRTIKAKERIELYKVHQIHEYDPQFYPRKKVCDARWLCS